MRREYCKKLSFLADILVALVLFLFLPGNALSSQVKAQCRSQEEVDAAFMEMWQAGSPESQAALISCVQEFWEYQDVADPAIAGFRLTESSYLVSALQLAPRPFFETMDKRIPFVRRWLKTIEQDAFTWFRDPPCGRDAQLISIKTFLRADANYLKKYKSFDIVSSKLLPMHCVQVD